MASLWDDGPAEGELRVNKDYAHRFEDRKRKQELDRLRQQYGDVPLDGDDSDDSEAGVEEDDDGAQLTREIDVQIFRTIDAIRSGDPAVRDKTKRFFDNLPAAEAPVKRPPPAKPAEKKLTAREYMLSGAHSESDDDGGDALKPTARKSGAAVAAEADDESLPYAEQQRRLKRAFLSAFEDVAGGGDDGDALLSARQKTEAEKAEEAEEYAAWLKAQLASDKSKPVDERVTLRRYLDEPDANLTPEERFLRDYVSKQLWRNPNDPMDAGKGGEGDEVDSGTYRLNRPEEPADDEADEGFSDREAEFERKMNFRFEEPGADRIAPNPRRVADSVRRDPKKEARKAAEAERRAVKAAKLEETKRELQRLKALKREEIVSRLERIRAVSGGARAEGLDVEADFDPDKWDAQMGALFDDEYYAAAEHDPAFAARIRRAEAAEGGYEGGEEEGEEEEEGEGEGEEDSGQFDEHSARGQPAKGSFEEKVRQMADKIEKAGGTRPDVAAMLDEYYGLEYEDLIAGEIPTRFRYRQVEPRSFGLSDEELLLASDKELNRRVPLSWVKRPYAERYATIPQKGERGYRPKPRAASEPSAGGAAGASALADHGKEKQGRRTSEGNGKGGAGEKRAHKSEDGPRKKERRSHDAHAPASAGARSDEKGGDRSMSAPAASSEPAKPPSKKQLRKKLQRQKQKAAAGVPELPPQRLAAYSKLKVKEKHKKKRGVTE